MIPVIQKSNTLRALNRVIITLRSSPVKHCSMWASDDNDNQFRGRAFRRLEKSYSPISWGS
jgi:hypothetical protein